MKKIITILAILMMMAICPQSLWADDITAVEPTVGDGSSSNPYEIATPGNLVWFAEQVHTGHVSICGKLTADIDLGNNQTMIGYGNTPFDGTFDGNDHTITVAYDTNTGQNTALFCYIGVATIKNLKTAGTITTSVLCAGGIVAYAGQATLSRCQSSIAITSTYEGDGKCGGLIGSSQGISTITHCMFNGTFTGEKTYNWAGLVGATAPQTINSSLFAPSAVDISDEENSYAISNNTYYITGDNNYYVLPATYTGTVIRGDADKKSTLATSAQLASGYVCYGLNGAITNKKQAWYQTIGTDTAPVLDSSHMTVYGKGHICTKATDSDFNNTADLSYEYDENGIYTCECGEENYQPATLENSEYLLANKGNLAWFAKEVNNGSTSINGKLTADIDFSNNQSMIGTSDNKFSGTFDGGNHTVTVAYTPAESYTALFRYVDGATIKNLYTAGTIETAYQFAAGLVAHSDNGLNISCSGSSVAIKSTFETSSDGTHGGIVANNAGSATLSAVYFNGQLLGENAKNCGGLIGWSATSAKLSSCLFCPSAVTFSTSGSCTLSRGKGVTCTDCCYTTLLGDSQGINITAEALKSGEACYYLNGTMSDGTQSWYQTIGSDDLPVLDSTHGTVYGNGHVCTSAVASDFNNTGNIFTYSEDGIYTCSKCSTICYQPADLENSSYSIANKGNFIWFANKVNSGNTSINADLTSDIDLGDNQTMIGTSSNRYTGTFNGNKHTITVHYDTTSDYTALFRYFINATVNDLKTAGTITTSGKYASGIIAYAEWSVLNRCQSSVAITSTYNGDGESAGLVAFDYRCAHITDCIFSGSFTGQNTYNWSGIVGAANYQPAINSCLFIPSAIDINTTEKSYIISNFNLNFSGENDYYVMPETYSGNMVLANTLNPPTQATKEELAYGLVCYGLNGGTTDGTQSWYQTIGTDDVPVLDSTHGTVYCKEHVCQSLASNYSNSKDDMNIYDVDGIYTCPLCGTSLYQACESVNSIYLISNKGNLMWFAKEVATGGGSMCAKLTADIDLGEYQNMIGTPGSRYSGTFDGNNHTITVHYEATGEDAGLFSFVQGATIKNLKTAGSLSSGYGMAGGIIGFSYGATITNCECSMTITDTATGCSSWVGGIVGKNSDDGNIVGETIDTQITLTNVVFNGKISTACSAGGIIGYSNTPILKNCLFAPTEAKFDVQYDVNTFVGCTEEPDIQNCYYTKVVKESQGTKVSTDVVTSGELCYKTLNNGVSDGTQTWYQTIGTDATPTPIKNDEHLAVISGSDACPSTKTYCNYTHDVKSVNGYYRCQNEGCPYCYIDPFNVTGIEDGTIAFTKRKAQSSTPDNITATIEYSSNPFDSNPTWTEYTFGTELDLAKDATIYFRAKGTDGKNETFSYSASNYIQFSSTAQVAANGNITSLLSADGTTEVPSFAFAFLFYQCTNLMTAPKLPATTLGESSYRSLFQGCKGLTTAPELPATTLATDCYVLMFRSCTSLVNAPALPATTLAEDCYLWMFQNCTSLTSAPTLSATTLAASCYSYMFKGCTGLTAAPKLPATTLAEKCYNGMYEGCTGMTAAPELPATTLAEYCYNGMFNGCTGLTVAPELPATTLTKACYSGMFNSCTGLTSTPELPATTLAEYCYKGMYEGCTGMTAISKLPATTLAENCYQGMYAGCTSLTSIPELPATTLAKYCYNEMFKGCTALKVNTIELGTAWTIPADATSVFDWNKNIFEGTSGSFTGDPVIGTTYYVNDKPYTRSMTNKWGTVVLPFDVTIDAEQDNYDFYSLTAVSSSTLTLTKMTGKLSAGTPAIIRMGEAAKDAETEKYELSLAIGDITSTTINNPAPVNGLTLTGTYTQADITDKDGYIIANNSFWNIADIKGENKVFCQPFRAYLAGTVSGAKQLSIGFADADVDGIEAINAITTGKAEYYDLNGRRINGLQKGINIMKFSNGITKKVIIK